MKKYFFIDESPTKPNKYTLHIDFDLVPLKYEENTYFGLIYSKLFNLTYADFCRVCRDSFGAVIYGKDTKYPTPFFTQKTSAQEVANILNKRMELVLIKRSNNGR